MAQWTISNAAVYASSSPILYFPVIYENSLDLALVIAHVVDDND